VPLRQKILIGILTAAILAWWGGPRIYRLLFGSLEARRSQLQVLQDQYERKDAEQTATLRAQRNNKEYRRQSLPADPYTAQRQYQAWLTDRAQAAGFRELKVTPGRRAPFQDIYVAISVRIDGLATVEQLAGFLYAFYQADLLHSISQFSVTREAPTPDEPLEVSILAEGLALAKTKRSALLPEEGTGVRELAHSSDLQRWSSEFAAEDIFRAYRPPPVSPPPRLPAPRTNSPPTVYAPPSVEVYPGQAVTAEVSARDAETPPDALRFELGRDAPPGARIDPVSGEFSWTPPVGTSPRTFEVPVVAQDSGTPPRSGSGRIRIRILPDAAATLLFTGSIVWDEEPRVWLQDTENSRRIELSVGDSFDVAGIRGQVTKIESDALRFAAGDQQYKLSLGESLRSARPVSSANGDGLP